MNMKKFIKPELKFNEFKTEDIITTSGGMVNKGPLTGSGWSKIYIGNSNRPGGLFN